jgi:hypothetical protein
MAAGQDFVEAQGILNIALVVSFDLVSISVIWFAV